MRDPDDYRAGHMLHSGCVTIPEIRAWPGLIELDKVTDRMCGGTLESVNTESAAVGYEIRNRMLLKGIVQKRSSMWVSAISRSVGILGRR